MRGPVPVVSACFNSRRKERLSGFAIINTISVGTLPVGSDSCFVRFSVVRASCFDVWVDGVVGGASCSVGLVDGLPYNLETDLIYFVIVVLISPEIK